MATNAPSVASADGICHLLRLPRELRDEIYRLSFLGHTVNLRSDSERPRRKRTGMARRNRYKGFLLANRQLHFESLESFYAHATFHAHDQPALVKFLNRRVHEHLRGAVRKIHCAYEVYCPPWNSAVDTKERPWIYYRGPSSDGLYWHHERQNNRNVAIWELEKLQKIRMMLHTVGIALKRGVLKAQVRVDGVHLEWTWKDQD